MSKKKVQNYKLISQIRFDVFWFSLRRTSTCFVFYHRYILELPLVVIREVKRQEGALIDAVQAWLTLPFYFTRHRVTTETTNFITSVDRDHFGKEIFITQRVVVFQVV